VHVHEWVVAAEAPGEAVEAAWDKVIVLTVYTTHLVEETTDVALTDLAIDTVLGTCAQYLQDKILRNPSILSDFNETKGDFFSHQGAKAYPFVWMTALRSLAAISQTGSSMWVRLRPRKFPPWRAVHSPLFRSCQTCQQRARVTICCWC